MASIWSWTPWHRYSQWNVDRHGRLDGRAGIPETDQVLNPPFIMELKNVGEELIAEIASKWEQRDAKLLADYCIGVRDKERLETAVVEATTELKQFEEQSTKARAAYAQHFHVPHGVYLAIMLLIAVGEFPLNAIVFQLFGDAKLVTYCASAALGVSLPVLAHCLGGGLREGFLKDGRVSARTVLFATSLLSTIGVILGIAYFREKFFEGSGVQQMIGVQMDVTTVTAAFVFINLFFVSIATLVAYFEHNPEAKVQRYLYKDAKVRAKRAHSLVKKLKLLQERNDRQIAESSARRERMFRSTIHDIKQIRDWMQRLMSVYRASNLRTREGATMPKSFGSFPDIDVPQEFVPDKATLSWNCGGIAAPQIAPPAASATVPPVGTGVKADA